MGKSTLKAIRERFGNRGCGSGSGSGSERGRGFLSSGAGGEARAKTGDGGADGGGAEGGGGGVAKRIVRARGENRADAAGEVESVGMGRIGGEKSLEILKGEVVAAKSLQSAGTPKECTGEAWLGLESKGALGCDGIVVDGTHLHEARRAVAMEDGALGVGSG